MDLPGIEPRWLRDVERAVEFVTLMDGDDRLLYVNHPQPGVGDVVGSSVFEFVAPAYHGTLREVVARAKASGLPQHFGSQADGPNGEVSQYSNWIIALPHVADGVVAIVATDVTHTGRVEKELETSESTLSSLVDHLPDTILIVDAARRIQFVNRLEHGFERESVIGIPAETFVPELDRHKVIEAIEHVLATGATTSYETRLDTPEGTRRFTTRAAPIPVQGAIDRVMLVATDITAEHEAELERQRLTEQLQQAQKMESIGQLTGGVAHDFNNLLTAIGGNLELARTGAQDEAERDGHIDLALAAVQRASELTERLLAFSRKQALQPQVVDLGALVGGMHDLLQRSLGETVEVRTEIDPDLRPCEIDPTQMEAALLNLAVNARDAMERGGTLLFRCSNVRSEWTEGEPEASVRIEVVDEGVGMSPAVLSQAFEPFFTTKDVGEGSGLGLSMVYGFVRQSGGDVRIDSEPGRGTTVEIVLPASEDSVPEVRPSPREREVAHGRGQRVLVVEDDPQVRALTARILEVLGYRTAIADCAAEAIERLATEEDVALVLSDVVLPGGTNGFELAESVRTHAPGIPVVLVSGYPDARLPDGGLDRSVDPMLRKPFTIAELGDAVDRALGREAR